MWLKIAVGFFLENIYARKHIKIKIFLTWLSQFFFNVYNVVGQVSELTLLVHSVFS